MKRYWYASLFSLVIFLFAFGWLNPTHAALLKFDQFTYTVNPGDTFQVQVIVDPGTDQITSVDAYINYDSSILTAQSVTAGSYFTTVLNDLNTGRAYVAGLVDNPSSFKTGVGTIATITFKANASGTTTLTYDCGSGNTNTSKVIKNDINSTNIITCSQNGSATVTVGGGSTSSSSGGTTTTTTTTTTQVTPTALPRTGAAENTVLFGILGLAFVGVGGIVRRFL